MRFLTANMLQSEHANTNFNNAATLKLIAYYHHVTYAFQSESALYSVPEYQGTPCSKQAP